MLEENKFTEQHLKDAFEFMDKKPVPRVEDSYTVERPFEGVIWLPKKEWNRYVRNTALDNLTEEEIKLLKLK